MRRTRSHVRRTTRRSMRSTGSRMRSRLWCRARRLGRRMRRGGSSGVVCKGPRAVKLADAGVADEEIEEALGEVERAPCVAACALRCGVR